MSDDAATLTPMVPGREGSMVTGSLGFINTNARQLWPTYGESQLVNAKVAGQNAV